MKSKYLILTFLLLLFTSHTVQAAPSSPLNGSYVIGGATGDYATIGDAVAYLTSNGISGDVTFRLRYDAGTFDEQVTITNFQRTAGAETATVTFQSSATTNANANWTYSGAASGSNWIARVDGADYINFRYINFTASEPTNNFGRVIVLKNGANHITIEDNAFNGLLKTTNAASIIRGVIGSNNDIHILNNTFSSGFRAIDLNGLNAATPSTGTRIVGNTIEASYIGGIRASTQDGAVIDGNTVSDSFFSDSAYIGIYTDGKGTEITNNKVDVDDGEYGIYLESQGSNTDRLIANNMVAMSGSDTDAGIYMNYGATLLHNTVLIDSSSSSAAIALLSNNSSTSNQNIFKNNILINAGTGLALSAFSLDASNHNNLKSNGTNLILVEANFYATLADYQSATGLDADSVSVDVTFADLVTDFKDLHLGGFSIDDVDLIAPSVGISADIDTDPRNSATVTMGADEGTFAPLANSDTDNGFFTVAGFAPDFATLQDAIDNLNIRGIKDDVTFNVRGGTYDTHATIGNFIRHDSATTNPVIFQGANPTNWPQLRSIATSEDDNWIVKVDAADYVEFRRINFVSGDSANYSRMLMLDNGSSNTTIDDVIFSNVSGATSSAVWGACLFGDSSSAIDDTIISNSQFLDCPIGAYLEGTGEGTRIQDNIFTNPTASGGAIISGLENTRVEDNTITGSVTPSTGILLADQSYSNIERNTIALLAGGTGIKSLRSDDVFIVNNFITSDEGILLDENSSSDVHYNTVSFSGDYAIKVEADSSNIVIYNNIFQIADGVSGAPTMIIEDVTDVVAADYNLHRNGGGAELIEWDATSGYVYSFFQATGFEEHGYVKENHSVTFVDVAAGDLHLAGDSDGDPKLIGQGLIGLSTDFDGDGRSGINPTIGADEAKTLAPLDNADTASGIYKIGGSAPDFVDVDEAINHLNKRGIKGDVSFNIRAGTYETHADILDFPRHSGTTDNPVIFRAANPSNWPTLTWTAAGASDNYVIRLNGADHVELRQLNFEADGAGGYATSIELMDGADDNIVDNNTFTVGSVAGTQINSAETVDNFRNVFSNNTFTGGHTGISLADAFGANGNNSTGAIIENNVFQDQSIQAIEVGHDEAVIRGNAITGASTGIRLFLANAYEVSGNQINLDLVADGAAGRAATSKGIWVGSSDGTSSESALIANNFIKAGDGVEIYGSSDVAFVYNSIHADGNYALLLDAAGSTIEVKNNILQYDGTSGYVYDGTSVLTPESNFNMFDSDGDIRWNGSTYSLATFQSSTGLDPHSDEGTVTFANAATGDLHLAGSSIGDGALTGTPLAAVRVDIDGDLRSPIPHIGADEPPATTPTAVSIGQVSATTIPPLLTLLFLTLIMLTLYRLGRKTRA